MKKYFFIYILLLFPTISAVAQVFDYGNNWYRPISNRTFIKIIVEEDGVYRVSNQQLQEAGFDLTETNLSLLQLHYRGKEVPVYIAKENEVLSYIEFFGQRNDGREDSIFYRNPLSGLHAPNLQPNKNISLFSDESTYFLSVGNTPGKRYIDFFDPTYSLNTPENYFTYESRLEYHPNSPTSDQTVYVRGGGGAYDPFYALNCDYITGEGYVGPAFAFGEGKSRVINIPTPAAANLENRRFIVQARVFGRSNTQHRLRIELDGNQTEPVLDTAITANQIYIKTYQREYLAELDEVTDLEFFAQNPLQADNNNICWASIVYDRLFDLNNAQQIRMEDWNKLAPAYFQFKNADGNEEVYAYDLRNPIRARGLVSAGEAQIIVPGFPEKRDLFIVTDKGIKTPRLEKASFNKLHNPDNGAEYVIITHRLLEASAIAYAQYRDTASVTPISSVSVVYTDEIYDEYGYGTITPWAIKRFCKDALDNWKVKPKYFLLWGKGNFMLRDAVEAVVPTFGYPATDYEFISHFEQNSVRINPLAAIGRVNVYNNQEGFEYLDKVNQYEHSPWESWMKSGVFLGGGATAGEQNAIKNALLQYIDHFTAVPFGGSRTYFQKTSTSTQEQRSSAPYHEEISKGTAWIHFFGHSTANIQDVSLKEPFEYKNEGRYPFMIAMGCFGGDFTPNNKSFGERWVSQKGKGSIGYLGGSSAGYLNPLRDYGRVFYQMFYHRLPGNTIGEALRETLALYTDSLIGIQYRNHGRQMNLQADPAIILYRPTKPDLEVNATSVIFSPENFSAQEDSFNMQIIIHNLAQAINDSVLLTIEQRTPDGTIIPHYSLQIPAPKNADTLSFTIYNTLGNKMTGQNEFTVFIDANGKIDEYNENNNKTSLTKLVPGNIPAILYPTEYAVIAESQTHLDASAFFITQSTETGYIFEIDTAATFDSPFLNASGVVKGSANYATWDVPFSLQEGQVYYWRVRLSDVTPSIWGSASFKYIPNKTGWAQAQLPQFAKDPTQQIIANQLQRVWEFDKFGASYNFSTSRGGSFEYSVNGTLAANASLNGFYFDGVAMLEIDQFTLEPVYNVNQKYNTHLRLIKAPGELNMIKSAILSAQQGNYFIIGSTANPRLSQWDDDLFQVLELIGASGNIRLLQEGDAFLILGRKGYPGSAIEVLSPNVSTKYTIEQRLKAAFEQGTIYSTQIGPATDWRELYWGWESQDEFVQETVGLKAYSVQQNGRDSLILDTKDQQQIFNISGLDAQRFPYMRLEARVKDTVRRTAPQMDNWHVLYVPVPDAVIDPSTNFSFQKDTISEGEEVSIRMQARNITSIDMDSLLVKFSLLRSDRVQMVLDSIRVAPLLANQSVDFSYSFNSLDKDLEKNVSLIVEINPNFDQPEQHQFNNTYIQPFYVIVDKTNPIVDVTFDGKHIIDGDIVSPRPEIVIQVNDENTYAALSDTSTFDLFWTKGSPNAGNPFRRIPIAGNTKIDFQPGELPENKALIYFYPGQEYPLEDAEYWLRVQGRDIKGNEAGKNDSYYEISFEVVNQRTVTNVLNYPNPFSSSTRFVYTLTGEELPEVFQLHIYTISGKQIKVIDLLELGEVRYGRNITDYAWDGTDDFGDPLANGVYLYRTVVKMPSGFTLREEGTEKYFKNGWGKMYIMR